MSDPAIRPLHRSGSGGFALPSCDAPRGEKRKEDLEVGKAARRRLETQTPEPAPMERVSFTEVMERAERMITWAYHRAMQPAEEDPLLVLLSERASKKSGKKVTPEQMRLCIDDRVLLFVACKEGRILGAEELLERGVSPNFYHAGEVPLVKACAEGSVSMVRLLLQYKADVQMADRFGMTPLKAAQEKNHQAIVELLEKNR